MEDAEVHVIGGGLGGLAAAALVARSGRSVVVHERRGRLGGRATTDERNGYRFNQGPHALYLGGEAMGVLRELGIPTPGDHTADPRRAHGPRWGPPPRAGRGGVAAADHDDRRAGEGGAGIADGAAAAPRLGGSRRADGERVAVRPDRPGTGPGTAARHRATRDVHERPGSPERRGGDPADTARARERGAVPRRRVGTSGRRTRRCRHRLWW